MARKRTDNHFFTIIKIQQEIVSRQRSQHTRLHVRRKLWFIASCFITAPAGLTESHTRGLVVQCEEHTTPASKHSMAEICILAPPGTQPLTWKPLMYGRSVLTVFTERSPTGHSCWKKYWLWYSTQYISIKAERSCYFIECDKKKMYIECSMWGQSLGNIIRW